MKQRNGFLLRELTDLISQLSFTDEQADYKDGNHWTIYAHPWVGEKEGFDLLITITPHSYEDVTTVQELSLSAHSDGENWCPDRLINRKRGEVQVWFLDLPLGKHLTVRFDYIEELEEREELALAATSLETKTLEETCPKQQTYYLPGRRIIALLEEDADGGAVLTIETEAPEFAGATVQFTAGRETGFVILKSSGLEGVWRGICCLRQSFKSVETKGLTFGVETPQSDTE